MQHSKHLLIIFGSVLCKKEYSGQNLTDSLQVSKYTGQNLTDSLQVSKIGNEIKTGGTKEEAVKKDIINETRDLIKKNNELMQSVEKKLTRIETEPEFIESESVSSEEDKKMKRLDYLRVSNKFKNEDSASTGREPFMNKVKNERKFVNGNSLNIQEKSVSGNSLNIQEKSVSGNNPKLVINRKNDIFDSKNSEQKMTFSGLNPENKMKTEKLNDKKSLTEILSETKPINEPFKTGAKSTDPGMQSNPAAPPELKRANTPTSTESIPVEQQASPIKRISDLLFKSTIATKSEILTKEDAATLVENNNKIKSIIGQLQKIQDTTSSILSSFVENPVVSPAPKEKPKDVMKYQVIEVTDNKKK